MILRRNARGIASQLAYIVEHHSVLFRNRRGPVILLQRSHQHIIQGNSTQKLCVGFDSIMTAISNGNDGGDHFVLSSGERKVRRHQYAECGKRMMEGLWIRLCESDDLRGLATGVGWIGTAYSRGYNCPLRFNGATQLLVTSEMGMVLIQVISTTTSIRFV